MRHEVQIYIENRFTVKSRAYDISRSSTVFKGVAENILKNKRA